MEIEKKVSIHDKSAFASFVIKYNFKVDLDNIKTLLRKHFNKIFSEAELSETTRRCDTNLTITDHGIVLTVQYAAIRFSTIPESQVKHDAYYIFEHLQQILEPFVSVQNQEA